MFIGHFAVGMAAKSAAPRVSLGTTFIACQLLDLIWPVLVLAGVERVHVDHDATAFTPLDLEHYPFSHSLGMSVIWSVLAFSMMKAFKSTHLEALVIALTVFSHWLLDFVSHRPDLPLWFGDSPEIGLGLWNSVPATLVVELVLFAAGVWLYTRKTAANSRRGRWGLWALIAFLLLLYAVNAFGPRPPEDLPPGAIAGPALATWLFVLWAWWADRNRTVSTGPAEVDATRRQRP